MRKEFGGKTMQTKAKTFCSALLGLTVICAAFLLAGPAVPVMADDGDQKPIAYIEGTRNVTVGTTVYLDGSMSKDPGGNSLSYQWTLESAPSGSTATMEGSSSTQAQFEGDVVGTYRVKLIVSAGSVDSNPAYATVTVTNKAYQW
jgi:hypothetical protein